MNPKKYLKRAAKRERQTILEEGRGRLEALERELSAEAEEEAEAAEAVPQGAQAASGAEGAAGSSVPAKRKKPRLAAWLIAAAGVGAILAAAVCGAVFSSRREEVPIYYEGNVVSGRSDLAGLNAAFREFSFAAEDASSISVFSDAASGDVLYYSVALRRGLGLLSVIAVCNPYYKYESPMAVMSFSSREMEGFTVLYNMQTRTEEGFVSTRVYAEVDGKCEKLYFEYDLLSQEEQPEAFFTLLSSLLHKK